MRFARTSIFGVAFSAWLLSFTTVSFAQGAAATINMAAESFDQTEVHITAGQTILWRNPDFRTHTVTADDSSFDSGDVGASKDFSMEFDTPGTYPYYCQYHGNPGGEGMSGVIVVDAG